ncbi:MAG: hypothetical protein KDD34_05045, partial [Bdellovibrionales bacterium]|nr:hypothetical protein [Bdellovibrionales bacterium]
MKRSRTFSNLIQKQIESYFGSFDRIDQSYKHLIESIIFISDHFQSESSITPWGQEHRQEAYFLYFHTLNTLRMEWVFLELQRLCPDFNTETIIDFGSGLGSAELAFKNVFSSSPQWRFIENS